ncbi:major facilitator superfamily transporter [Ophiostoma piceae UAMH 11346]|uniref:Major facilitator superfamily transporter n=1 Tax=Ophiostoma piceae (strain UAMH 11346) TaxID=1262450 RepID=S3BVP5_OPHP1|nr:major facilitator superfamily transporter [Ophiostoma piceae UAMH 11346]
MADISSTTLSVTQGDEQTTQTSQVPQAPQTQQAHEQPASQTHKHNGLHQIIHDIDERDAEARYREEAADNIAGVHTRSSAVHHHNQRTPSLSDNENDALILAWSENDHENPYNFSSLRKASIVITTMLSIINSTMGSSLPSNAIPYMAEEWGVTSTSQKVLPMSTYLIGYIFGPLVWAPLSEQFGRQKLSWATFAFFIIWTMACALAPNWPAFLVFRLFCGTFASAPIAIVTGILADIFDNPVSRGRAMAFFMVMTLLGPLIAPIVSGYCSTTIGWRWTFWIGLIYAGASLIPLLIFLPETYGPILLRNRAIRMRKADPKLNIVAPHELEKKDLRELMTVVLTRPLRMILFEMIVTSVCAYLALVYAIFYMTFQAYPLIFEGIYHFGPGKEGLIFLTIGAGSLLSLPIFYAYDMYLYRATQSGKPWTKIEEYRRLPLACLGGPVFVISLFWLGWSARSDVSFVVPMLAGVPFGLGFMLIFLALLNYITDAYEIFAASANAAASCCRSLLATVLPLATAPMFTSLEISGACSLLGGLSCIMCVIPFIFIWKGEQIRANSKFCIALRERKIEMLRKVEEQRQRQLHFEQRDGVLSESEPVIRPDQKETV